MSFAGGYDLSKLKRSDVTVPSNPEALSEPNPSVPVAPKEVAVVALVMDATEETLRDVLAISAEVAVLIEFHADSVRVLDISAKLRRVCEAFNGAFVLVRVDAQLQQRVGQAFGVKGAPTLIAVLKGQPVPLFEGEQDEEAITKVVDRVIEVARENGVTGIAVVKDAAQIATEQLPPLHQKAFDEINAGEFDLAIATYEQAIRENPRDDLAVSGLAQVKLLQRTLETSEVAKLQAAPELIEELLLWADFKLSSGLAEEAFGALLDAFETNFDARDQIRMHLIELFAVVEPTNPTLLAARKRLASLLY
jgi:putative thioredoxin